jgi:Protein of unknown function (DUF3606)
MSLLLRARPRATKARPDRARQSEMHVGTRLGLRSCLGKGAIMPDDLSKKGPADRSKVSFTEPHEVQYWADKFGVSKERLGGGPEGGSLRGGGRKGIEGQPRIAVAEGSGGSRRVRRLPPDDRQHPRCSSGPLELLPFAR